MEQPRREAGAERGIMKHINMETFANGAEAMQNIKEYLTKALEDISDEKSKITIIA